MLGSVEDGQFAKLPSGEALERQLKNHTTVTAQVCVNCLVCACTFYLIICSHSTELFPLS